ncbi:MAG: hypothetical protein JXB19_05020 [Bacteroidales bacterium]|nr:hypothetical protein [Bacteroidales bacterium]
MKKLLLVFSALFAGMQFMLAQGPAESLRVSTIRESIVFDGVPDEDVWQTIETLPMVMLAPVSGNEPTE